MMCNLKLKIMKPCSYDDLYAVTRSWKKTSWQIQPLSPPPSSLPPPQLKMQVIYLSKGKCFQTENANKFLSTGDSTTALFTLVNKVLLQEQNDFFKWKANTNNQNHNDGLQTE